MKRPLLHQALLLLLTMAIILPGYAQSVAQYYMAAKGEKGAALKTSLANIISDHVERSYTQLWTDFKKTDVRADGTIWDMYSDVTEYIPGSSAQGANSSKEGDGYNREHSFPKSWFNKGKPMYTDLFHLYPTDGYVNGRRSNYPFGETDGDKYQSKNGFSKLGESTLPGYSGIVFEPNDEYKGDFARTYFYMVTAYESKVSTWSSPMLSGNKYPAFSGWALEMLLRWAQEDPVSEKEVNRNNAVYSIQKNRNPYIDYPGLEQYVWGSQTSTAFDPENYGEPDVPPTPTAVTAPVFTPQSGIVEKGTQVNISTETEGAKIYYQINGAAVQSGDSPVTMTIDETSTIVAYAKLGDSQSKSVTATYTLRTEAPSGEKLYTLLLGTDKLSAGQYLLIVCRGKQVAMAEQGNDIRNYVSVTENDNQTINTTSDDPDSPYTFILGGQSGAWTLFDPASHTYLGLTSNGNKLFSLAATDGDHTLWDIEIDADGTALISNVAYPDRFINYNASSPRFACYKSTSKQQPISLFAYTPQTSITKPVTPASTAPKAAFDIRGTYIRSVDMSVPLSRQLPEGLYVIDGEKFIIR